MRLLALGCGNDDSPWSRCFPANSPTSLCGHCLIPSPSFLRPPAAPQPPRGTSFPAPMANSNGAIIFQWLERIGLGYSIPTFQAMGITNPHSLVTLTVEDYDAGASRCGLAPPVARLWRMRFALVARVAAALPCSAALFAPLSRLLLLLLLLFWSDSWRDGARGSQEAVRAGDPSSRGAPLSWPSSPLRRETEHVTRVVGC